MHVIHESHVDPHEEGAYIEGGTSRFPGKAGNPQLVWAERAEMPFAEVDRYCSRGALRKARGSLARRMPCRPRSPMSPMSNTTGHMTGILTLGGLRTSRITCILAP